MTRADDLRTRYEAELAVVVLEEQLVAAKVAGEVPRELKDQLREARQTYRAMREGDAVVSPSVIEATAAVEKPGGAD